MAQKSSITHQLPITKAEKDFFAAMRQYTYDQVLTECDETEQALIHSGRVRISVSDDRVNREAEPLLLRFINSALTYLYSGIREDGKNGRCSDELAESICTHMNNESLNHFIRLAVTDYRTKHSGHDFVDFPLAAVISEWAEREGLPAEEREIIKENLDVFEPGYKKYTELAAKMRSHHFYAEWQKGRFTYPESIFETPGDITLFCAYVGTNALMFASKLVSQESVEAATDILKERLQARETELAERQAQIAEAARRRDASIAEANTAREAREKADDERKKAAEKASEEKTKTERTKFLATAQPYMLAGTGFRLRSELETHSISTTGAAVLTQRVLSVIDETHAVLDDIRPEPTNSEKEYGPLKDLGDLLLSASNIAAATKAFGAERFVQTSILADGSPKTNTERLQHLYETSAKAHKAHEKIDELLANDDGIILLATITREPERTKAYANFLASTRREINIIEREMTALKDGPLQGMTAEELSAFKGDTAVDKFFLKQDELAAKNKEIDGARHTLADEIRHILQGEKKRTVAAHTVPAVTATTIFEVPEAWAPILGSEYEAVAHTNGHTNGGTNGSAGHTNGSTNGGRHSGEKYIDVRYKKLPELSFVTKRGVDLKILESEKTKLVTNVALVEELIGSYGFSLFTEDKKPKLSHPEYGISISFEGKLEEQTDRLIRAKEQFMERQLQQQSILESAKQAGFEIDESEGKGLIILRRANTDPITVALTGYLSAADFNAIDTLLNPPQFTQPGTIALEKPAAKMKSPTWPPDPKDTLMIFDSAPLVKLAAKRANNGHTWLDIMKHTANLPNVMVIIPSIVANWELQGRIVIHNQGKRETKIVNTHYQDKADPRYYLGHTMQIFLTGASHARLLEDGSVEFTPGTGENKHIVIMDTPEDEQFYNKVKEHVARHEADKLKGSDEGEAAISRIVKNLRLPSANSMIIVSDDKKYFHGTPLQAPASLISGQGMPVGQCASGSYVDAEIQARKEDLQKLLGEEGRPFSLRHIDNEVFEYWEKHRPGSDEHLFTHNRAGSYLKPNGKKSLDIYALIKEASEKAKAGGYDGEAGDGPGSTAHTRKVATRSPAVPREPVLATPITPTGIDTGSGRELGA